MDVTVAPWKQNLNSKGLLNSSTPLFGYFQGAEHTLNQKEMILSEQLIFYFKFLELAKSRQTQRQAKANSCDHRE